MDNIINTNKRKLRIVKPWELYRPMKKRFLNSSVTLPSQYNAYSICTEWAREWFLSKFPPKFFTNVYIDGSKTFDQFRRFAQLNQQLKRTNPQLAIQPNINTEHSRDFIDRNMELTGYLRRARFDGTFFSDNTNNSSKHLAVQFKTILMTFNYKMRLDTKAQQLDMLEFIKYKHRAAFTESEYIPLDVHVPKKIINQIAFDNNMLSDDFNHIKDNDKMLKYLNTYSVIPFLYKKRNSTGTYEYFIRCDNCGVHVKSELPSGDEQGDRIEMENTNFIIDFQTEVEMLAPFCFVYYSERPQDIINSNDLINDETSILLMRAARADFPDCNEVGWNKIITTEYIVEDDDLKNDNIVININPLLDGEIRDIVEYTKSIMLNPSLFMDFLVFNNTSYVKYKMDWDNNQMIIQSKCTHPGFNIAVYIDMKYVNETRIHHNFSNGFNNPDSFNLTSRIGKLNPPINDEHIEQ